MDLRPYIVTNRQAIMHALKIILLLLLTLLIMRVMSYGLAWPLIAGGLCRSRLAVAVIPNFLGLLLFLGFLHWDRTPGEFLDYSAAVFGAVVYAVLGLLDSVWHPLRALQKPKRRE